MAQAAGSGTWLRMKEAFDSDLATRPINSTHAILRMQNFVNFCKVAARGSSAGENNSAEAF
jgi:hypothetical protein